MIRLTRLVLDVLKPHQPDALAFAARLAETGEGLVVTLDVVEMDEKTESLRLVVEGDQLDLEALREAINDQGGSLHSIDGVQVRNG